MFKTFYIKLCIKMKFNLSFYGILTSQQLKYKSEINVNFSNYELILIIITKIRDLRTRHFSTDKTFGAF